MQMNLSATNMLDAVVELYVGFYRLHCETYNTIFDEIRTENFAKGLELDTVDTFMFNGLFNKYPQLVNAKRQELFEELKNNNELHGIVDDIFCRCWG